MTATLEPPQLTAALTKLVRAVCLSREREVKGRRGAGCDDEVGRRQLKRTGNSEVLADRVKGNRADPLTGIDDDWVIYLDLGTRHGVL